MKQEQKIGFIGQGFIGKNYANDFEARGYSVVRYAKEAPYDTNAKEIADCGIVFIAVPTPTTPDGFDDSIVHEVLAHVGEDSIAVIKSTVLPGTTEKLQSEYSNIVVLHSPEFLRERSAVDDAAHPTRNIIGIPKETDQYKEAAEQVLGVLPNAPYQSIVLSKESELVKYAANNFLYMKVVYANMLYDLAQELGCAWEHVRDGVTSDPRIGPGHFDPIHASGHTEKIGRGAGGHCFIKDMAALRAFYETTLPNDAKGSSALRALECKNISLLLESEKDLDLLKDVYGSDPSYVCES